MPDSLSHLAEWHTHLKVTYSEETSDNYFRAAFRYLRHTTKPLALHREGDAAAWLESFPQRSASRQLGYHALSALFTWAMRNGIIDQNPVQYLKPRSPEEKVAESLTYDEVDAIIAAAFERTPFRGYTVELLYYAGGRITETRMLTWDCLGDVGITFKHTKGNRERVVPWSDGLRHATDGLRSYFGDQPVLVPRTEQTIGKWLKEAALAAGVDRRVYPHLFRSTAITHMLRGGARHKAVQSIAGHKTMRTTSRYVADDEADNREAVAILDRRIAQ